MFHWTQNLKETVECRKCKCIYASNKCGTHFSKISAIAHLSPARNIDLWIGFDWISTLVHWRSLKEWINQLVMTLFFLVQLFVMSGWSAYLCSQFFLAWPRRYVFRTFEPLYSHLVQFIWKSRCSFYLLLSFWAYRGREFFCLVDIEDLLDQMIRLKFRTYQGSLTKVLYL